MLAVFRDWLFLAAESFPRHFQAILLMWNKKGTREGPFL
jgi:hypothetical protein